MSGQILGGDGKPLSDATVVLEQGGMQAKSITTSADGRFMVDSLPPGEYTVVLVSRGKRLQTTKRVLIESGSASNFSLTFGDSQTETTKGGEIVIAASAPTIQLDSAQVSRAYDTNTVRSLPLLDRQYQQLIGLMPGVTPPEISEDRVQDPQGRRTFHVNGLPSSANSYFQDGSYQVEPFSGQPSRIAPNESIQQMNVRTSNYNAEYGYAAGSWTNTVTRPGTNGLHGSAFGLNTNRFFVARNPLNSTTGTPGFNRNQFGGSVGGPIIANKTFMFGAYEGMIRRGEVLQLLSVPSADFRAGNFSSLTNGAVFNPASGSAMGAGRMPFPGGRIPAISLNARSQAILAGLPLPNQPGQANNLVGGAALIEDNHRFDGKLDHRFSERSTGFFRYGFTQGSVNRGSLLGVLGDAAQGDLRNHNAVASLTQSFTNNLAGEFRAGYSRYRNLLQAWGDSSVLNQSLSAQGFSGGLPQINIAGFGSFGLPGNFPSKQVNNTFDFATNWNWHNGMHHLKFGAQLVAFRTSGFDAGAFSPRGTFNFGPGGTSSPTAINVLDQSGSNAFASFVLGVPTVSGVSSFLETPTYEQAYASGYVTDTINLWRVVQIELGVRYDVFSPLRTRRASGASNFDPTTNQLNASGTSGFDEYGNSRFDRNNIAPRVGIVINPVSRIAVRAGYGIHYFPVSITQSALNQSARGVQAGTAGGFGSVPFSLPTIPVGVGGSNVAPNLPFFAGSLDSQTPYVQSYNAMIQADLGNGFLLDVGYVGNVGRQLPFSRSLNVALPGSGMAGLPFSAFGRSAQSEFRGTGLNSNYNSGQVNLTKRFVSGLAIAGAYTFGKALDYGFNQANPFASRSNYGPADWDRRQILAVSHNWRLPFGKGSQYGSTGAAGWILGNWELNGILHWATGTPYNVTANSLACNCPGLTLQPAVFTGNGSIDGQANFNASQFSVAPAGTFGSQGRNSFRGPDLFSYDASLFRNFSVRENFKLELRGEAYNVTNTTNYTAPQSTFGSPNFGTATRTFNGVGGRQFPVGASGLDCCFNQLGRDGLPGLCVSESQID